MVIALLCVVVALIWSYKSGKQHLLDSKEIKSAEGLASYYSYGSEPETSELNKSLIQSGKTLLLPRRLADNDLDWIIWSGKDEDLEIDGKIVML